MNTSGNRITKSLADHVRPTDLPIDVVERDIHASARCDGDYFSRNVGHDLLPTLHVRDVPLRNTDLRSERLLRQAEALPDGLYVVHARNISPTDSIVQSSDCLHNK